MLRALQAFDEFSVAAADWSLPVTGFSFARYMVLSSLWGLTVLVLLLITHTFVELTCAPHPIKKADADESAATGTVISARRVFQSDRIMQAFPVCLANCLWACVLSCGLMAWARYMPEWCPMYYIPLATLFSSPYLLVREMLLALGMFFIGDFLCYWYHLLSHKWRWMYRVSHSWHHETMQPVSWRSTMLMEPVESVTTAFLLLCPCLFVPAAVSTLLACGFVSTVVVGINHSGRRVVLPWLGIDSRVHDLHHSHITVNYAEYFPIIDKFFGTYLDPANVKLATA